MQFAAAVQTMRQLLVAATVAVSASFATAAVIAAAARFSGAARGSRIAAGGSRCIAAWRRSSRCGSGSGSGSGSARRRRSGRLRGIVVVVVAILVRRWRKSTRRCLGEGHCGWQAVGHGDDNRQSCRLHDPRLQSFEGLGGTTCETITRRAFGRADLAGWHGERAAFAFGSNATISYRPPASPEFIPKTANHANCAPGVPQKPETLPVVPNGLLAE